MPKYILGISAFYHDSAACLLKDGEIVAAVSEERLSRKKHDPSFPKKAIEYCLKSSEISRDGLNLVVFYDKPFVKFERLLLTHLSYAPFGLRAFVSSMLPWIKQKLFIKSFIEEELNCHNKLLFSEHHLSHAASAFYPSPFNSSAVLTVDGVGEWATASYGVGRGNDIKIISELKFPHSVGLLYSTFTYYTGFKVNSGEYKLMGLAPYGKPKYVDLIKKELIDIKDDGSIRLNLKYFNFCSGLTMTSSRFNKLFGAKPRRQDIDPIEQRHMDLACSVQVVTEEILLKMVNFVHNQTKEKNLCLAGGVALNCVANGRILKEGPFENIWIQPSASDAGGALGAAFFGWYKYLNNKRAANEETDSMKSAFLGPEYSDEEIESYLNSNDISYEKLKNEDIAKKGAQIIADGNVLGWFQGRLEFGPRALGNRSIIGDACSDRMQSIINQKIKFRESFRPFAPTVLVEHREEYFDLKIESPYMLIVAPVAQNKRFPVGDDYYNLKGFDKLRVKRSVIPAVTHIDFSARVQTVRREDNSCYYNLIEEFFKLSGCPVVINTSFNVRGEPIVASPEDAYRCFMRTNMDYLIMGSFLLDKNKQGVSEIEVGDIRGFEPN